MHEMEGPRRVLLPCGRRSLGVRRPCRTCSSCSVSRLLASRARGTGCSLRSAGPDCSGPAPTRSGCPSRSAGPDRSGPAPTRSSLLAVRRPDRSGPAPTESGCPADLALIARDPPARDCLASPCLDCSGQLVARPAPRRDRAIARLSTPRNPSPSRNPLRTAVSRCSPRPGSRPPGRSPFPVTRRFLVAVHPAPQGLSRSIFHEFRHPQDSPQAVDVVPRKPGLSTASSTGTSTATCRTVQHLDTIRPPPKRTGYRRTPSAANRSTVARAGGTCSRAP